MNKIRKDDLDALGEMAGIVGMYMNDYAEKTTPDARHKLFAGGKPNVRETLAKALLPAEDIAQEFVPADGSFLPATPGIDVNQQPQPTPPKPIIPEYNVELSTSPNAHISSVSQPPTHPGQMEFDFKDHRLDGIGSIRDILTHFNDRLDKIEDDIKLILKRIKE